MKNFGTISIIFADGSEIALPISEDERQNLDLNDIQSMDFFVINTMDNRAMVVRTKSVAQLAMISDDVEESAPYASRDFWQVLENAECQSSAQIAEETGKSLEEVEMILAFAAMNDDRDKLFDKVNRIFYQLSNGKVIDLDADDTFLELYSQLLDLGSIPFAYLESFHQTYLINKEKLNYASFPLLQIERFLPRQIFDTENFPRKKAKQVEQV